MENSGFIHHLSRCRVYPRVPRHHVFTPVSDPGGFSARLRLMCPEPLPGKRYRRPHGKNHEAAHTIGKNKTGPSFDIFSYPHPRRLLSPFSGKRRSDGGYGRIRSILVQRSLHPPETQDCLRSGSGRAGRGTSSGDGMGGRRRLLIRPPSSAPRLFLLHVAGPS
jgi:hypothetical protein